MALHDCTPPRCLELSMLQSGKTGKVRAHAAVTATNSHEADIYLRYAVGLYRQALFDRHGSVLASRARWSHPRALATTMRAMLGGRAT
jgi:hypothetical protein